MRAVCLQGGFGFEQLRLEERSVPSYEPDQILIRVRAVSLNARDLMTARGEYNPRQRLPLIPCSDALGEVVARGARVSEWQVGDRVCPIFAGLWQRGPLTHAARQSALGGPRDGTLSEYMALHENAVVRAPAHLSSAEAACLPCTFVTAYRALVEFAALQAGQWLVCVGTGGVSLAALAIARALGVRVIVTSRSSAKLELVKELGAEAVVDTSSTTQWGNAVRELTGGEGADHVLEVGGAATIEQSLRAVRLGGSASVIGVLSGARAAFDLRPILMQELRIQGVFVGSRETFRGLLELVRESVLEPRVAGVFPLTETRAAFEYAATGQALGKVVVSLD